MDIVKSTTATNTDNLYIPILERTKGAWGSETSLEKSEKQERKKLELEASKKRQSM